MFTVYTHRASRTTHHCVQQQAQQQKQRQAQQQEQQHQKIAEQHQKIAEQQYQEGAEQQHQKPTAPDSEEEEDEDGDVTQIFVKTDEGRTSALQVTNRDTTGEIVRRACGRTTVDEGSWHVQCQGRMFRNEDIAGSCRVEDGDMLQLTRRICGGGGNKNRKRSAKKENTGRRVDQEKEKVVSELNEARITRMLRERSDDDIERLIRASVNWSKESLGVSDEIEEGIRNMLERFQHERLAEEGDRRKGPQKGRGCASLVQCGVDGHHEFGRDTRQRQGEREWRQRRARGKRKLSRRRRASTTKTGKKGAHG